MPITTLRLPFTLPSIRGRFNGAAAAGPRRILAIACGGGAVAALLVGATFLHGTAPTESRSGRLPAVNPLPGGLNSNPQQDTLAVVHSNEAAAERKAAGQSFTPQIVASQLYQPANTRPLLTSPPRPEPKPATPAAAPEPLSVRAQATLASAPAPASPAARVIQAQAQAGGRGDPEDARYKTAIDKMMGGWGTRMPRTDVILPPEAEQAQTSDTARSVPGRVVGEQAPAASQVAARSGRQQRVLIPAGRGIYAHTILAASSDAASPVVLQADSGPIAGDRMVGSFSREEERLVIRVNRVIHNGQEISVEGIVIAPGTMETSVASSVDQHYGSRFILPAAAAFVAGLGQAFALSNSTITQSPFGGATALQRLNLGQQFGVGAGVAAGRVGQTLDAAAPKGPTVKVDVNSSVGVMFLSNVVAE